MYINEADNLLDNVNTVRVCDSAFNKEQPPVFQEDLTDGVEVGQIPYIV